MMFSAPVATAYLAALLIVFRYATAPSNTVP